MRLALFQQNKREYHVFMLQFLKKNFALVLAFSLPVILIAVVTLNIYLPSVFLSTDYNFLYTACTDANYYYANNCGDYLQRRFTIVDGKLVVNPVTLTEDTNNDGIPDQPQEYTARLFLHDTGKNESREITIEEAQTFTLNNLLTSPDGVSVSGQYNRSGGDVFFFFGGGSSSFGYYLTKGGSKSRLNLIHDDDQYYYRNNFHFVGWVLPARAN